MSQFNLEKGTNTHFIKRLGTELKTEVGGYIFAKLGLSGLVTGVQTFKDKRVSGSPIGNNVLGILPGTR